MTDDELRRRSALLASALERADESEDEGEGEGEGERMEEWLATLTPEDAGVVRRALTMQRGDDSLAGVSFQRFSHLLSSASGGDDKPVDRAGERLGAWSLERKLGEGGMGEVWLAARADNLYQGKAAIKLLRADLDRSLVERRFAREREVLARLDHPNIARLLDAGLSARDEYPFLVLEFVEGASLLAHVQTARLGTRERVKLVRTVADAVAYAHGRLVVHRDLKPQNIVVNAAGEPKILDFGIAGLLDDEGLAADGLTRVAGRALTLEYCAPEQVTGVAADARTDVRIDVFSLGVVLYELLSGTRPYAPREKTRRALEYAITHDEPAALDTRRFDASLAAIVAKALARDPASRYSTMAAFAGDLGAWLDNRPVSVAAPSALERIALWSRRNRALAAATATTILAVATGLVVSIWLAEQAREQERIAVAALADVEQQSARATSALARAESESARAKAALARAESESSRAEREAANAREQAAIATTESLNARRGEALAANEARKARAVSTFVFDLFQAADPEKAKGEKLTARDVIDAGAAGISQRFADQPDTLRELQRVLGTTYTALSRSDKAIPLLAAAAKAQEAQLGKRSIDRARTLLTLAHAEIESEKFADAAEHYREGLPIVEASDGPMANDVVVGKTSFAFALCKTGKTDECLALSESLAADVRAKLGEQHWLWAEAQNGRASALSIVGRWKEMPALLEPLEPLLQKPPPGKLADALTIRANLAVSMARNGNVVGAVARLGPLADEYAAYLGPESDRALVHRWFLADYQRQLGKYADCFAQYAKLVEVRVRVTGRTHPLTVDVLSKAALCARNAGDERAAKDYLDQAFNALPAKDDPPQRTVLRTLLVLSNVALDLGEIDRASAMLARADALVATLKLETSDEWITLMAIQGNRFLAVGDVPAAIARVEAGFATPAGQRALGSHAIRGLRAYNLALAGRMEEARAESAASRSIATARLPMGHPYFKTLDYVDAIAGNGQSREVALAAVERAFGRPVRIPLAPIWFSL